MRSEHRERGPEPAVLSSDTPFGDEPLTADERRIADALARGLGRLREARPGFQDRLERRLLDRLAEPARPWWQRALPSRSAARRATPGAVRMPRRSFVGLAAASALVLAGASVSLPLVGTPEVSAREILEKVQANSENPGLAGVKSFHLTAKIWSDPSRFGKEHAQAGGPREATTEQWFVAPDRMRTESRSRDAGGKAIVSGMMANGTDFKHYATSGATDVLMFAVFAAPIGAKPAGEVRSDTSPTPGGPFTAGVPAAGARVSGGGEAGADDARFTIAYENKPGAGSKEVTRSVVIVGEGCQEPKRTGEATIAGRPAFVVENDFSACLPADAPAAMKGRHVRWVDQKTFLPLKMEMYDQGGALVDRYEVTAIEYDVEIPAKTFTELPAGTSLQEPKLLPMPPRAEGGGPVVEPIAP